MAELQDVEERVRSLEVQLARLEGKSTSERLWFGLVAAAILAWLGVTSFVLIPGRITSWIENQAVKESVTRITDFEKTASQAHEEIIKKLTALRNAEIDAIIVQTITLVDANKKARARLRVLGQEAGQNANAPVFQFLDPHGRIGLARGLFDDGSGMLSINRLNDQSSVIMLTNFKQWGNVPALILRDPNNLNNSRGFNL